MQDFCTLKIKITQFPDGFRLKVLKKYFMLSQDNAAKAKISSLTVVFFSLRCLVKLFFLAIS